MGLFQGTGMATALTEIVSFKSSPKQLSRLLVINHRDYLDTWYILLNKRRILLWSINSIR